MKKLRYLPLLLLIVSSCTSTGSYYERVHDPDDQPALTKSLFPSDQSIISQEAIDTILASRVQFPMNSKVAIINFPASRPNQAVTLYGYGYWRSEDYLKLQQSYIDYLSSSIVQSDYFESVVLLPSMLTPQQPTLPVLREASVRLQSSVMLIFRINSDIYDEFRFFRRRRAKAFATIEIVMLDIRTGIIPFTSIVTEEYLTASIKSDSNFRETMKRAEREATLKSLETISENIGDFLRTH